MEKELYGREEKNTLTTSEIESLYTVQITRETGVNELINLESNKTGLVKEITSFDVSWLVDLVSASQTFVARHYAAQQEKWNRGETIEHLIVPVIFAIDMKKNLNIKEVRSLGKVGITYVDNEAEWKEILQEIYKISIYERKRLEGV